MTTKFQRLAKAVRDAALTKETLAAILFLVGLVAYERTFLNVPFSHYLGSLARGEYLIAFGALFIVFVSWFWAAIFLRASLSSTYAVRVVYFALFAVAVTFEYGYQRAFARFSKVEDLRIALFDATAQQRRDSIIVYASWWTVIPCAAYAVLLVKFRNRRRRSWFLLGLLLAVIVGFYSAIAPYISGNFTTISLNAFLRTVVSSPWKWASGYRGPRNSVPSHAEHRPRNNIILVVDESVRGDHLSINGYSRATTPSLEGLLKQGWLYNWGITAAGSNCSFAADSMLFTGMTVDQLPDTEFRIRRVPNIFQYAKAMGYKTHALDGQKENYWLGSFHDKAFIDHWEGASRFAADPYEVDVRLAQRIDEIIKHSAGNFIWVTKSGIHYPYMRAFPSSAARWQPSETSERIDPNRKEEMNNAYDNALRHNLEGFFGTLNVSNWANHNILIYTSDHGQTLSEHGETHTHCGSTDYTYPTEAKVPLLIITRGPLSVDTGYRATHANVFPALLDLMNFPAHERQLGYAPSLLSARTSDSQKRYFWVGEINERILGSRIAFDP